MHVKQTYHAPSFSDSERLLKIQKILPQIDQIYQESAEKNHFPGYAYGIIVDNKLIHKGSGGWIDLDKKRPATPQSMFRIASMTKSFTAMAILKLRDAGKLKIDDPVYHYIPELPKQLLTEDAPHITIRDLLTHSAGFPTDDPWADRKLNESDADFISLLNKGLYFSNVPGNQYEYSNLGYTMLGVIIQKISGIHYGKFILDHICKPLGMDQVSWDFEDVSDSHLAHGYRWIDQNWKEEKLLKDGIFGAMGGMITSIESFSQYVAFHLAAWPSRNEDEKGPLKRSSVREMHQPWRFKELICDFKYKSGKKSIFTGAYGYGLNWFRDDQGKVFVWHGGGLPGFGSNWMILPDYGIGLIFFANVTYAPATLINFEVIDKIISEANLQPRILPPSQILKERQQALIKLLPHWENATSHEIFAENFFLDFSLNALKKETKELFLKAGPITCIGDVVAENQLRGHFVMHGEKMNLHVRFALTPEIPSLIQHYQIKEIE